MRSRVQKWGNSLAVRIPRPFAAEAGLSEDAAVEMTLEGDALTIRPAKHPTLNELLALITDENVHESVDSGAPIGDEAW